MRTQLDERGSAQIINPMSATLTTDEQIGSLRGRLEEMLAKAQAIDAEIVQIRQRLAAAYQAAAAEVLGQANGAISAAEGHIAGLRTKQELLKQVKNHRDLAESTILQACVVLLNEAEAPVHFSRIASDAVKRGYDGDVAKVKESFRRTMAANPHLFKRHDDPGYWSLIGS
jgi:hypothetical protein